MIDLPLADLIEAHEEEQSAQPIAVPPDLKQQPPEPNSDAAGEQKPGHAKSP